MQILGKKTIIKKTIQVGSSTLISRFFGIIRELLMVRYLGAGIASDAFLTAFKVPNSLRKIFAEGALSAAFVPSFVTSLKHNKKAADSLMSLAFILFEGGLLCVCAILMIFAPWVIWLIAPGFDAAQIAIAVPLLRILMPFIFFISSSALLAGALQSVGKFFVPAFGPILLNVIFIAGLLICYFFGLPVTYLCFFILFGGFLQCVQHLIAYFNQGFGFGSVNKQTWQAFRHILKKFFPCLVSMSVMEISLFIDTGFASYLHPGSISLLYYANRFMNIPLGVFAVALSTILLPHFSRISTYAPARLNFYILESAKLVFWVTLPCTLLMIFFARDIFTTLFLSDSFTRMQANEAASILIAFMIGLFFFSFNKILLNIFYSRHETKIPSFICLAGTLVNIILNFAFMSWLQGTGLALATTLAGIFQTALLFYYLYALYGYHGYLPRFFMFVWRYVMQLMVIGLCFAMLYYGIVFLIGHYVSNRMALFLLEKIGFWLWVGPLCAIMALVVYVTRNLFNIRLYFLD